MEFHRRIKKSARASLQGSWGQAVAIVFTVLGVYLLISALEQALYLVLGLSGFLDVFNTPEFYLDDSLNTDLGAVLSTGFSSLLLFLLGAPLTAGSAGWYFSLSAGTPLGFEGLFRPFTSGRSYIRVLGAALLVGVRSALWGVAFLLPPGALAALFLWASGTDNLPVSAMLINIGFAISQLLFAIALFFFFVFLQRYSLVYYLLADRPQVSAARAVGMSVKMMKNHKWESVSLRISFVGWHLLSLLILPMLYTAPFYHASMAIYSRYVIECFQRAQMGDSFVQPEFQDPQENQDPLIQKEDFPGEREEPVGDDGKTKEYAFSDLQQQMEQR